MAVWKSTAPMLHTSVARAEVDQDLVVGSKELTFAPPLGDLALDLLLVSDLDGFAHEPPIFAPVGAGASVRS